MMKQCRQCGRSLDESCFRKTKSRSAGIYKTKQGSRNICKECESMNVRAHKALKDNNIEALDSIRRHYQQLNDAGFPPITSAARQVLGMSTTKSTVATLGDLYEHIGMIRRREYATFDDAEKRHKELLQRLVDTGLYEEANNLLDDWYLED